MKGGERWHFSTSLFFSVACNRSVLEVVKEPKPPSGDFLNLIMTKCISRSPVEVEMKGIQQPEKAKALQSKEKWNEKNAKQKKKVLFKGIKKIK